MVLGASELDVVTYVIQTMLVCSQQTTCPCSKLWIFCCGWDCSRGLILGRHICGKIHHVQFLHLICLACTFRIIYDFISWNFILCQHRSALHARKCPLWTSYNFFRYGVWFCTWEEVRIIWWDLGALFLLFVFWLQHADFSFFDYNSAFCSSSIFISIVHIILIVGNNCDMYSVLLHGHNPLCSSSCWKDNSCPEKHGAVYWFSSLIREKYQFGCDGDEWSPSKGETST